ncbi:hypothetical protein DPMN_029174 [Dreissena polymorpha]|uniref:Uncharacterized protein n=1 Tax=Dreissena polymorpha TaxID=45954 RepID=A0A9D4LVZ7_DREPO|nr:hypothetical protein DPMN_029174 [Dreissena polymorpha]
MRWACRLLNLVVGRTKAGRSADLSLRSQVMVTVSARSLRSMSTSYGVGALVLQQVVMGPIEWLFWRTSSGATVKLGRNCLKVRCLTGAPS